MDDLLKMPELDFSQLQEALMQASKSAQCITTAPIQPQFTVRDSINEQTRKLTEQGKKQIESISQQNKHLAELVEQDKNMIATLSEQNGILTKLLERRDQELKDNKEQLKKSKRYNIIVAIIAFVSMLAAVASWATPLIQKAQESRGRIENEISIQNSAISDGRG